MTLFYTSFYNLFIYINCFLIFFVALTRMNYIRSLFYGPFQLSLVLVFTYIVIYLKGLNKMVDVVTNRIFDTFHRYSNGPSSSPPPPPPPPVVMDGNHSMDADGCGTIAALRRYARDKHDYKKLFSRSESIKNRENQLYDIKETVPLVENNRNRPLMGLSCDFCTNTSRESLLRKTTEKFALKNVLDYQPVVPRNLLQRTFSHLHQVYQLKKFPYTQVTDLVLKNPRYTNAISTTTQQQYKDEVNTPNTTSSQYEILIETNRKRAKKLLYDMRSTLSDFLLRFTSWILYKLLPCFLTGVVTHPGQIDMLKSAAASTNLPLIFLPLHRSHLDYILISFILLNNDIRSPLVAAGDNLKIPFFGSLLRGLGAFFIKRRIQPHHGQKDHIYKAVLHTYMNECLRAGHNIEFFLEGGRTRTGKPCMPKYGILSVIVDALLDGTVEDALLVPVSVNYERLVDGNFVREQLGQPKEMETFGAAIRGIWHVLNSDYGTMRIDFNQPFSLKELVNTFNNRDVTAAPTTNRKNLQSNPSTSSLFGTDLVSDQHRTLVEPISKHIIYDCAQSTAIMSTNALAFLLLTRYRHSGATLTQLCASLDDLRDDLLSAHRDLGFSGDSEHVIRYACEMFGRHLIHFDGDLIRAVPDINTMIELSYYSNTLVAHYALESIVAVGVGVLCRHEGPKMSRSNLVDCISVLADWLQYEFLLMKPCQRWTTVIENCIDEMVQTRRILCRCDEDNCDGAELRMRSRRMAQQFEDDNDDNDPNTLDTDFYVLNDESQFNLESLEFLQKIVAPLIDTYWMVARVLRDDFNGEEIVIGERDLIMRILEKLRLEVTEGRLTYAESVSVDTIKNALKLYEKWQIVDCQQEERSRVYSFRCQRNDSDALDRLTSRIDQFRIRI